MCVVKEVVIIIITRIIVASIIYLLASPQVWGRLRSSRVNKVGKKTKGMHHLGICLYTKSEKVKCEDTCILDGTDAPHDYIVYFDVTPIPLWNPIKDIHIRDPVQLAFWPILSWAEAKLKCIMMTGRSKSVHGLFHSKKCSSQHYSHSTREMIITTTSTIAK